MMEKSKSNVEILIRFK